jgi:hypothetical protein
MLEHLKVNNILLEPYQKEGRNSKSLTRVEGNFSACGV